MVFQNYNLGNNQQVEFDAGVTASATTAVVKNGDILPTSNFPMIWETYNAGLKVIQREGVIVGTRVGNTLSGITRGAFDVVQDDTATTLVQGTGQFAFSSGDFASVYVADQYIKDIQDELVRVDSAKLDIADFLSGDAIKGTSSTGTDAYQVTMSDVTAYSDIAGRPIYIQVDVSNTSDATLEINALGAKDIVKFKDEALQTGDIVAGQIIEVIYNSVTDDFEISNAFNQGASVIVDKFTQQVVLGEDVTAGDGQGAVFFGKQDQFSQAGAVTNHNIGNTAGDTLIITNLTIQNRPLQKWVITDAFGVVGSPADGLLVTFTGIANTSTTLTVSHALATAGNLDIADLYYTTYGERLLCDGQMSAVISANTIDASNYYTIDILNSTIEAVTDGSKDITRSEEGFLFSYRATSDGYAGISGEFREESGTRLYLRVYKNDVLINEIGPFTSSFVANKMYFGYVKAGETISIRAYNSYASAEQFIYWQNVVIDVPTLPDMTVWDGLESNKVWLSDVNIPYYNNKDGIVIQSGVAGETKNMVTDGPLSQTSAEIGSRYYLNNNKVVGSSVLDLGPTFDTTVAVAPKRGCKIETSTRLLLGKVTIGDNTTATTAYLYDSGYSLIDTVSISDNVAIFNNALDASTSYYIVVDAGGASFVSDRDTTAVPYPVAGTNLTYTAGVYNGVDNTNAEAIKSIETTEIEYGFGYFSPVKLDLANEKLIGLGETDTLINVLNDTYIEGFDIANNTVYQAEQDGFVVGCVYATSNYSEANGYVDNLDGTTLFVSNWGANNNTTGNKYASITMPVKKGQFYKVNLTGVTTPVIVTSKFYSIKAS